MDINTIVKDQFRAPGMYVAHCGICGHYFTTLALDGLSKPEIQCGKCGAKGFFFKSLGERNAVLKK